MNVFIYDGSFDGFLTLIFEVFRLKIFPQAILTDGETPPLLSTKVFEISTDREKAGRVWAGLEKKLSRLALRQIMHA